MEENIDRLLRKRGVTCYSKDLNWKNMDGPEKIMTKEEALAWLSVWRSENIPKYNLYFPPVAYMKRGICSGMKNIYLNGLVDELAERIRMGRYDPVTTVADYNYEMDNLLAMSDNNHHVTHRFVGFMERASYEILLFLKEKEKEMNRK